MKVSYNDKRISSLRRYNYRYEGKVKVLVIQSYLFVTSGTVAHHGIPPSSVHGILQVRMLEWVAIPFSRGSSWTRDWARVSALQADSLPFEPAGMRQRRSSYNDKGVNSSRRCNNYRYTYFQFCSTRVY